MKLWQGMRVELARLSSSKMSVISLIALMTIPVMYGGLYLWGNRDPYGRLDRVPVALVVADQGVAVNGSTTNFGQQAAEQLKSDGTFNWTTLSSESEARSEVDRGRYDFAVVFPVNFSSDLNSAGSSNPSQASIVLITDDTNSYLSTTIAKQAATSLSTAVAASVAKNASQQLLAGIAQLRVGISNAHDGATQLADGSSQLASGTASALSGASALSSGLAQLQSASAQLPEQSAELAAGGSTLSSKLGELQTGVSTLSGYAGSAQQITQQLYTANGCGTGSATAQCPALTQLLQLNSGIASGTSSFASSSIPLLTGAANSLSTSLNQLASGAPSLADGIAQAAAGASQLHNGLQQLNSGATSLDSGAGQLRDGLANGLSQAPDHSSDEQAAIASAISNPVSVDQQAITQAQNYGAGLAPFFISLAAWIGIYALFLMVRPLSRRALIAVRRPITTVIAGWAVPASFGLVQMIALYLVLVGPLGLHIASPLAMFGFMCLISVSYAAIVQMLNVALGAVGQFIGLMLMVLQLVTAGGTFPWQTLPAPLAALHQFLPMSHAVTGMRTLMYGGDGQLWSEIAILLCWMLGSIAISILVANRKSRTLRLRELRPSVLAG